MSYTNLGIVFNKNLSFLKENKLRLVALSFVAAMLVSIVVPMASVTMLSAGTVTNHNDSVTSFETKAALQKVPGVLESSDQVTVSADGDSAATSQINGTTVDVPQDAAEGVTFGATTGPKLDIELPSADQASSAKQVAPGVIGYDSGDGSANAVQPTEDGGVRMLTIIDNPNAPTAYDYKVTVPSGGRVGLTPDGGAKVLDEKMKIIAMVNTPWAKDAKDLALKTWFTTDGKSLTQHVKHNVPGVAYPVTADPFWLAIAPGYASWVIWRCGAGGSLDAIVAYISGVRSRWAIAAAGAAGCMSGLLGGWGNVKKAIKIVRLW